MAVMAVVEPEGSQRRRKHEARIQEILERGLFLENVASLPLKNDPELREAVRRAWRGEYVDRRGV